MTREHTIVVPAPTVWPMVTAFGLTLLFSGLVTHVIVSAVGVVVLARGAVGWWHDVLPVERHDLYDISAAAHDPAIHVSVRVVEHLAAGVGGHRVRIPAAVHPYSAGFAGGAAGAVAMAAVAIGYGVAAQHSVWYVVNLLAAGVVPSLSAASPETLGACNATGLAVGCATHALMSMLVGLLYAVLLPMFPRRAGVWSGLATPIVWCGLVRASLDVVNPTMNGRIDWFWFVVSQIAFGLACAVVVARTEQIDTMQSWTWANRAGLEAGCEDQP